MAALTLLDALWVLGLLWVAWRVVVVPESFTAVVLFIAFGLLIAGAWARLGAVDVALAEATVGAGLGGALFLGAAAGRRAAPPRRRPGLALACAVAGAGLAVVLVQLPPAHRELRDMVAGAVALSGVSNPVTAVLLNFRAYDTVLELAVLVLAVGAVWQLGPPRPSPARAVPAATRWLNARLQPLIALIAGYLLWVGAYRPGGAFQAGALLAGGGVLWLLVRRGAWRAVRAWPWRLLVAAQLAVFVAAGLLTLGLGAQFLQYPAASAGYWILAIEAAASVGIAASLLALYLAGDPARRWP